MNAVFQAFLGSPFTSNEGLVGPSGARSRPPARLPGFWRLHVFGPEASRVPETETGVVFFLASPRDAQGLPLAGLPNSPLTVSSRGSDGILGNEDDPFAGLAYGVAAP